jgi:hypothetical protein
MAGPRHSLGMDEPCGRCGDIYREHGVPWTLPPGLVGDTTMPLWWPLADHIWVAPAARVQLAGRPE